MSSCPMCDRPTDTKFRPFCSKRCADLDLGKWLTGGYVLPGQAVEEEDELPDEAPYDPKPIN
ncbi:DNA gyrase inhibitor YacG [Algirhabdus cladophorae]|uniref:DNA gyrase inhibitor YacG n=1 Tax=Algirhabdus cladophorae TaxID=3377108 RepID=UPI003B84722B